MMQLLTVKKQLALDKNGASDFTKHNDNDRKQSYMNRHRKMKISGSVVLKLLGFMLNTFCGTNHLLNQVLMIWTNNLKIFISNSNNIYMYILPYLLLAPPRWTWTLTRTRTRTQPSAQPSSWKSRHPGRHQSWCQGSKLASAVCSYCTLLLPSLLLPSLALLIQRTHIPNPQEQYHVNINRQVGNKQEYVGKDI